MRGWERSKGEGMYVSIELIHFMVQEKLNTTLKSKCNKEKKKEAITK